MDVGRAVDAVDDSDTSRRGEWRQKKLRWSYYDINVFNDRWRCTNNPVLGLGSMKISLPSLYVRCRVSARAC